MQEKAKKNKRIYLIVGFIAAIGIFLTAFHYLPATPVGDGSRRVFFEVKKGSGSYRVAKELYQKGLIESPAFFRLYLRITGNINKLKAGVYDLNDGMNVYEITKILVGGRVKLISIQIPEGWNNRQIAEEFLRKKIISDKQEFFGLASSRELLNRYRIPAKTLEGYLFPDTYYAPIGYPAKKIIELMVKSFFKKIKKAGYSKNMSTLQLHQKVILASIIEREAKNQSELPIMAGVFLNRKRKRMRLESCATVQYLFPKPKKRLFNRDLKIESPYNTYLHYGFPPGPISNPGFPALKAALHPQKNDYLYFVLKPDGAHYFSKTYAEHLAAKKRFLR